MNFENAIEKVKLLYQYLLLQKEYTLETLTEGCIKDILSSQTPVAGIFLLYEDGTPVYIGRSANLAQRVGTDLRSLGKNQANVTKKLLEEYKERFNTMNDARDYFYKHFTIRMLRVEEEHLRALLQLYIWMELHTKYNSFLEH